MEISNTTSTHSVGIIILATRSKHKSLEEVYVINSVVRICYSCSN